MREARIETYLRKRIQSMGGLCYKFLSPGNSGVPDRLIVLPGGRVIFVELKTLSGVLSPLQRQQVDRLLALGADARIVYGKDAVEAFVEEVMPR